MKIAEDTEIKNYKDTLSNGLAVVTVEMPHIHTVEVAMFIRAGLRFENKINNGISHFLEHMMFRGNKKYPDSILLNREFEKIGRDLRASTLSEHTWYGFTPHFSKLEKGVEVFAEFFRNPTFPCIEMEREVILEEYLEEIDADGKNIDINNIACSVMYENDPLALTTIGTEKSIRNINIEMLNEYFQKYYNVENMILVGAGAIAHDHFLSLAEKYFESLPIRGTAIPKKYFSFNEPPAQDSMRLIYQEDDDSQFQLQISFHALAYNHPDFYALGLINRMFDDGVTSRLQRALREEKGMAYTVECRATSLSDIGTFDFDLTVSPDKICQAAEILLREVKLFIDNGPDENELSHVKQRANFDLDFDIDDPYKQLIRYGFSELYSDPISVEEEKIRNNSVSIDDIRRVAKMVFTVEKMNVILLGPDQPEIRKQLETFYNNLNLCSFTSKAPTQLCSFIEL
ncbi:MAG: M16 family metallopeptidase [Nitrospinales bacterium]